MSKSPLFYQEIASQFPLHPKRAYLSAIISLILASQLGLPLLEKIGLTSTLLNAVLPDFNWFSARILFAALAAPLALDLRHRYFRRAAFELKFDAKLFSPFPTTDEALLQRDAEVNRLMQVIHQANLAFICIIGQSGVGKSTINKQLAAKVSDVTGTCWNLTATLNQFTFQLEPKTHIPNLLTLREYEDLDELQNCFVSGHLCESKLIQNLTTLLAAPTEPEASANALKLLIVDQAERLFPLSPTEPNSKTALFTLYVLQFLLEAKRCKVLLSIRADLAAHCFEELYAALGRLRGKHVNLSDHVRYEVLPGIGVQQEGGELRRRLYRVWGKNDENVWKNFISILKLNDPLRANTFYTQLFGSLIEELFRTDKNNHSTKIKTTIESWLCCTSSQTVEFDNIFDLIFEELIEEYSTKCPRYDARKSLGRILYALACIARSDPNAIDALRIAGTSHLPFAEVDNGLRFLETKQLLRRKVETGKGYYSFRHDLIAMDVLNTERFELTTEYRDSVRVLSNRRSLGVPSGREEFLEGPWGGGLGAQWDKYVIVLCMVLCVIRATCDRYVSVGWQWFSGPINSWLSTSPEYIWDKAYIVIVFSQFAWVVFMYSLYHGYFAQISTKNARNGFRSLAPLGAIAGAALAYIPVLSVLPISLIGCTLGVMILVEKGRIERRLGTRQKSPLVVRYFQWGSKILFNMIAITIAITSVSWLLLAKWAAYGNWGNAFVVLVYSVLFIVWLTIRPNQGDRYAFSDMLALYDRGRVEQ